MSYTRSSLSTKGQRTIRVYEKVNGSLLGEIVIAVSRLDWAG